MEFTIKSMRPFIGSKDFDLSRNFYKDLGFEEIELGPQMSVFKSGDFAFYLQKAYVKDWVDNSMIFVEIDNVPEFWERLVQLDLTSKYKNASIKPIREENWGRECFVIDPSGILWHFGEFN